MKNRLFQKNTAFFLAVLLLCSLLPVSALADGTEENGEPPAVAQEPLITEQDSTEEPSFEAENPITGEDEEKEEPAEEGSPEEELPAEEETVITDGDAEEEEPLFPGMPEGFELSEAQKSEKAALRQNGIPELVSSMTPGEDYREGVVIISAASADYVQTVADAYDADWSLSFGVAELALRSATVEEAVAAAADEENNLPAVEPDYILEQIAPAAMMPALMSPFSVPAADAVPVRESWESLMECLSAPDPYIANPQSSTYQWMHDAVNSYEAWGVTTGSGVTVAVIDTGVHTAHPDLGGKVSTEDIGCGTAAYASHGTAVAGIIAAVLGNGAGGAGIAPEAGILSIRVITDTGSITNSNTTKAINRAVECGAKIINISLGASAYSNNQYNAIKAAAEAGVTVVVALGNNSSNNKNYPAAYDIPGLIAVGATDRDGNRAAFSSYGSECDVYAPGTLLQTTKSATGYGAESGTSVAAPVVAGMCALYCSVYPGASAAQVESAVKASASSGVVDAAKLFSGDKTAPSIANSAGTVSGGKAPYSSELTMQTLSAVAQSSGLEEYENDAVILYTTDGTAPAVLNGRIKNGVKYEDAIPVSSLGTVGKTVTVKAACITGAGTLSRIATYKCVIDYDAAESVSLQGPNCVFTGRSVQLTASVAPADAQQKITWSVAEKQNCASATIYNGKLTAALTPEAESGTVTVKAEAANGVFALLEVTVNRQNPAATMQLDRSKAVLDFYSPAERGEITVTPSFFDKNGAELSDVPYLWTSSNAKVATVSATGVITATGKGAATITCKANDGSGIKATVAVTVRRYATDVTIKGQSVIAPGKYATYSAKLSPSGLSSTAVTWSVSTVSAAAGAPEGSLEGVTLSKNKLTVNSAAPTGQFFYLTATAAGGRTAEKTIYVESRATAVKLYSVGKTPNTAENTLLNSQTAALYSLNRNALNSTLADYDESTFSLAAALQGTDADCVTWTSSKPAVAEILPQDGGAAIVHALSPGTATITCKADDGSGRYAKFNVKVITPCSAVTVCTTLGVSNITTLERWSNIAYGRAAGNRAALGDTFGKPTVTGVKWTIESGEEYATISSAGKLSIKKTAPSGEKVVIRATAKDHTGYYGEYSYYIGAPTVSIRLPNKDDGKVYGSYVMTQQPTNQTIYSVELSVEVTLNDHGEKIETDGYDYCTVKSSNPAVASATISGSTLQITSGRKTGTATITVRAQDGTNVYKQVKVNVKAP